MLQIPCVADRRIAVADVQLIRPGDGSLGYGIAAADHDVIGREVELLDGQRHQGQIAAILLFDERHLLQEGDGSFFVQDKEALFVAQCIDQGEKIGVRKDVEHLLKNAFSAAICNEPIVNYGYARGASARSKKFQFLCHPVFALQGKFIEYLFYISHGSRHFYRNSAEFRKYVSSYYTFRLSGKEY